MPSFQVAVGRFLSRLLARPLVDKGSFAKLRSALDKNGRMAPLPKGTTIEAVPHLNGEWVRPPEGVPGRVFYYLHGGGFCAGSCLSHRAFVARAAQATEASGFHLAYRLAPEHPFPAALDDAVAGYEFLLKIGISGKQILLAGDSAGGGLVLSLLLRLRDAGRPLPAAGICLSPLVDATLTSDSFKGMANADPMLTQGFLERCVDAYAGATDRRDPMLSPIAANLIGLPPLMIHVGSEELLLDDAKGLGKAAREAGVDVTLHIWEGCFHNFMAMGFIPEARAAMLLLGSFGRGKCEASRIV